MVKKQEKNEKKPQKTEEKVDQIMAAINLGIIPRRTITAVKLVTSYTPEGLESNINDWLERADNYQIVDIKLSCFSGARTLYHAMIVYTYMEQLFSEEEQADD